MDFAKDGANVNVHTCADRDTTSYVRYSTLGGGGGEVLANSAECDIDGFLSHPVTAEVQAVAYTSERQKMVALADEISPDLAYLEGALQGLQFDITSRSADDKTWIVLATSDCNAGDYYIYDRSRRQLLHQFATRPQLKSLQPQLASMHPVRVSVRDGETLLCYLSYVGEARTSTRPLVLYLHGGPSARDYWSFDPVVQLLCSRGMSVLQVNYRGSTGFGRRFMQLPYGNIDEMRRDVADAARWSVAEGIARHGKIAIMGGSWGGYETLCGMTFDSELYACGVAYCPLSTVGAADTTKAFRGDPLVKMYWDRVFGPAAKDLEVARLLSPAAHASRIRQPLMLVHGDVDVRVAKSQSDRIVDAMKGQGVPCYYVSYTDEGHGVKKERNMLDMWSRVERFLCRALELPSPPARPVAGTENHSAVVHWDSFGLDEPLSKF